MSEIEMKAQTEAMAKVLYWAWRTSNDPAVKDDSVDAWWPMVGNNQPISRSEWFEMAEAALAFIAQSDFDACVRSAIVESEVGRKRMTSLVERLRNISRGDHERGCQGREYVCSCDYDETSWKTAEEAAAEIERLTREFSTRRAEDAAAVLFLQKMTELVPVRDVIKATATVRTLIDYFESAVARAAQNDARQ